MKLENIKFVITPEMFDKCAEFAKKSVLNSADKYKKRNQFDVDKICDDIKNGKIAEEGAWLLLSQKFNALSKPDHTIYSKKFKSWDPDLKDETTNAKIAIKSQNIKSELEFGKSWVFQIGNGKKDCDKEIFTTDTVNKFVCFVSLNVPRRFGELQAFVKLQWLHDNKLFKPMIKNNLSSKVAVYYEDLEKFNKDELWQL